MKAVIKKLILLIVVLLICVTLYYLIKSLYINIKVYKGTIDNTYNPVIEIVIPLIITILGTFLGFILAIIGELQIEKIKTNKEIREIVSALIEEITINKSIIYERDELYHEFYRLYSFEGVCNSGKLYLINNQPWFSQLVCLYNKYREVNYYFSIAIKQLQLGNDDKKIIENQINTINELKEEAEKLLKIINT